MKTRGIIEASGREQLERMVARAYLQRAGFVGAVFGHIPPKEQKKADAAVAAMPDEELIMHALYVLLRWTVQ